jgi:hypothetical protein
MTSKEKITEILNCVEGSYMDWNFMRILKHDLEELIEIAQAEGIEEAAEVLTSL